MKLVAFKLDEGLDRRLKRAAKATGGSVSSVVRFALIQHLDAVERGTIRINHGRKV